MNTNQNQQELKFDDQEQAEFDAWEELSDEVFVKVEDSLDDNEVWAMIEQILKDRKEAWEQLAKL